jgi:hypothetical protein
MHRELLAGKSKSDISIVLFTGMSESFVQALVDFSEEAPMEEVLRGIEAQRDKRRATKQRGVSMDIIWTPRGVIKAPEEYRESQAAI